MKCNNILSIHDYMIILIGVIIVIVIIIGVYYYFKNKKKDPVEKTAPSPTEVPPSDTTPLMNVDDVPLLQDVVDMSVNQAIPLLQTSFPNFSIVKVVQGSAVTKDFQANRMRVWYDSFSNTVTKVTIG